MQDVAYGTTKLKYDSGETKTLTYAVLTTKYIHVIASYIQRCSASWFEAWSERTLSKLLQQLEQTQWHSLVGLDDLTADGMNSFSVIEKVVKLYMKDKNLADLLKKRRHYFNNTVPSSL